MTDTRTDRMPPLERERMDDAQLAAAAALEAGPRKGVHGPFIALLRSPELLARLQKVGEYLRFDGVLEPRISEFATLVVSRRWSQSFEWGVHVPLALKAGVARSTVDALREGRRPPAMQADEAAVHDLIVELGASRGLCDATYRDAVARFGERGLVELVSLVGYFELVSMVLNVAHTPPGEASGVESLPALPP